MKSRLFDVPDNIEERRYVTLNLTLSMENNLIEGVAISRKVSTNTNTPWSIWSLIPLDLEDKNYLSTVEIQGVKINLLDKLIISINVLSSFERNTLGDPIYTTLKFKIDTFSTVHTKDRNFEPLGDNIESILQEFRSIYRNSAAKHGKKITDTTSSPLETLGIITEEYHEYIHEVRVGDKSKQIKELFDIAIGAILGIHSVRENEKNNG